MKNLSSASELPGLFVKSEVFFISALIAVLWPMVQLKAQRVELEQVHNLADWNIGQLTFENRINGYYILSEKGRKKKDHKGYALNILDSNLNRMMHLDFHGVRDLDLVSAAYNGDEILCLFSNPRAYSIRINIYSKSGILKRTIEYRDADTSRGLNAALQKRIGPSKVYGSIYGVPGGFIAIYTEPDRLQTRYKLRFLSADSTRDWTYISEENGNIVTPSYLGVTEELLLLKTAECPDKGSCMGEQYVLGINVQTGKPVFKTGTSKDGFIFLPYHFRSTDAGKKFVLAGEYFREGDSKQRVIAEGLCFIKMDAQGTVLEHKIVPWQKALRNFAEVSSKGKVEELGYIFIHDIVQVSKDKIFVIGEGYLKTAYGAGIALNVLTAGSRMLNSVKITVTDLVIMQLNEKFEVDSLHVIAKRHNRYFLPETTFGLYQSPRSLGEMVKADRGFDYQFFYGDSVNQTYTAFFTDLSKGENGKSFDLHGLRYRAGEIDETVLKIDKTNIDHPDLTHADMTGFEKYGIDSNDMLQNPFPFVRFLPGKKGHVVLKEYIPSEQKLILRLMPLVEK